MLKGKQKVTDALGASARRAFAQYVSDTAEIGRAVGGEKKTPMVLYCGKSKRLAEELLAAGYTNVRRYQLGMTLLNLRYGLERQERGEH